MCLEELFCACPSRTDHVWPPPRQLSRMEVFSDLVVSSPEAKKRAELLGNVQEKDARDEGGVLRRRGALFGARQNGARRRDFDRRIVVSDKDAKRSRTSSLIIIDRPCFSASLFLLLRVSPPPLRIMTIRIKKNAQIPIMHPSHASSRRRCPSCFFLFFFSLFVIRRRNGPKWNNWIRPSCER